MVEVGVRDQNSLEIGLFGYRKCCRKYRSGLDICMKYNDPTLCGGTEQKEAGIFVTI